MGTCSRKSKYADLGRGIWKRACTTCLKMRSASRQWPQRCQSRALEFVWPCLWYFCFTFLCVAFQLRLAWPHCIGVPVNGTPLPVSPHPHRIELVVHCPYWDTLQIAGISACLNTFWNLKLSYLQIQAGMVIGSSSPGWDHWKQGLRSVMVAGSFLPTLP